MGSNFPISLERNNLQDSIITFEYTTDYTESYIESKLLHFLSQNNIRDFEKIRKNEQTKLDSNDDRYIVHKRYLYANKRFFFEVTDGGILLNCTRGYVGWNMYSSFIQKVLEFLYSIQVQFNAITMQYISAFPDTDILGAVDGVLKLNRYPRLEGTQFKFNMHIAGRDKQNGMIYAIVALTNYVRSKHEELDQNLSYVDIMLKSKVTDNNSVMEDVEYIHQQEKNLFFSMMSQSFIDSLKPIYK